MSLISVGPLKIDGQMLALILSMFTAYFMIKFRLKRFEQGEQISDRLGSALVIAFIVWKSSLIIIDPLTVFRYPLTLFYFDGGTLGWVLACMISSIYLTVQARKQKTPLLLHIEGIFVGWLAGSFLYRLFTLFFAWSERSSLFTIVIHLIVLLFFLIWLLRQNQTIQPLYVWMDRIILYGLAFTAIEFLHGDRYIVFGSFSSAQIVHFIITTVALIIKLYIARIDDSQLERRR